MKFCHLPALEMKKHDGVYNHPALSEKKNEVRLEDLLSRISA